MELGAFADEVARRDSAVTAIRHVLQDLAAERYAVPLEVVRGLAAALDDALDAYADAAKNEAML